MLWTAPTNLHVVDSTNDSGWFHTHSDTTCRYIAIEVVYYVVMPIYMHVQLYIYMCSGPHDVIYASYFYLEDGGSVNR